MSFSPKRALAIILAGLALVVLARLGTIGLERLATTQVELQQAHRAADSTAHLAAGALDAGAHLAARADSLSRRAASAEARADSIQRSSAQLRARLRSAAAPDTCAPFLALADSALVEADGTITQLRIAVSDERQRGDSLALGLDNTQAALRAVVASQRQLDAAATKVAVAARPSFLSRLLPHPGLGFAAGIDGQGRPQLVTGITLGWTF